MKEKTKRVYKLSAVLMVLCLITACVIGTTLAKYTTGGSANDSASVAKWGVQVQVGGTLFGKKYGSATATAGANTIVADAATDVSVSSTNKVIGPGTQNTVGMKVKLSGTPEVSYTVTSTTSSKDVFLAAGSYAILVEEPGVNAATTFTDLYVKDGESYVKATSYSADTTYYRLKNAVTLDSAYNPIVWSIGGTAQASLSVALSALVPSLSSTQAAGTTLNHDKTLTWAWALEHGTTDEEKVKLDNADTILGQLADTATSGTVVKLGTDSSKYVAIESTDYSLTVSVSVSVTVTQVD